VGAAVACPDLFLLDAPAALRPRLAADLAEAAVRDGQRVLVLTGAADAVVEMLAGRSDGAVARALAADEPAERCCPAVTERTAAALAHREHATARDHLAARVRECSERTAVLDQLDRLAAEEAGVRAALDAVTERAVAAVDASAAVGELVGKRAAAEAAAAAHRECRAAVARELAELRQHAVPAGGFLKRLFGGTKPSDPHPQVEAAEAKLRELDARAPADPEVVFRGERERLIAAEAATRHAAHAAELARITRDRESLTPPAGTPEQVRSELREWSEALADFDTRPAVLSEAAKERVRVTVGPLAAVGHDPLLAASHPEAAPRYDRVIFADADDLTEEEFAAAARLGPAWVLVGTAESARPPAYRNGTHPPKPPHRVAVFARFWDLLRGAGWEGEGDRLLARLVPVDARAPLACEPVVDRPDVEVRFTDRDGSPVLAEVLFPSGMPACDAKAYLAAEAGEVRIATLGAAVWHEAADAITCCWPVVDQSGEAAGVELAAGVRERVVGVGPAALTAAVTFDPAVGWTRESAVDWLTARTSPGCRTAVVR
jgi:hypothetical protein